MPEPLSITTACFGLLGSITKLSTDLTAFVLIAKDARKDIDGFLRELSSLRLCIETLQDEEFPFPISQQKQLAIVLDSCNATMKDMEAIVKEKSSYHKQASTEERITSSPRFMGKIKWSSKDRDEVVRLRGRLEALKSALDIALDMANLVVTASVKQDTTAIRTDTSIIKGETSYIRHCTSEIHENTSAMMEELAELRIQVMQLNVQSTGPVMLSRFLDDTLAYTESVVDPSEYLAHTESVVSTSELDDGDCETVVDQSVRDTARCKAPYAILAHELTSSHSDLQTCNEKLADSIKQRKKPFPQLQRTKEQTFDATQFAVPARYTLQNLRRRFMSNNPFWTPKRNDPADGIGTSSNTSGPASAWDRPRTSAASAVPAAGTSNIRATEQARVNRNDNSRLGASNSGISSSTLAQTCPIFLVDHETSRSCSCSPSLIEAIRKLDQEQCKSLLKSGERIYITTANEWAC